MESVERITMAHGRALRRGTRLDRDPDGRCMTVIKVHHVHVRGRSSQAARINWGKNPVVERAGGKEKTYRPTATALSC